MKQRWAGDRHSPVGEYIKFDVLCPSHPDQEMSTGGGPDLALNEKALATCPVCGHSVLIRMNRILVAELRE